MKAASLRKERQAQGREGSASPQSGDAAKENDGVDKRSPDRGDSRYGHPKSPTWRQSDHRRSRLQVLFDDVGVWIPVVVSSNVCSILEVIHRIIEIDGGGLCHQGKMLSLSVCLSV